MTQVWLTGKPSRCRQSVTMANLTLACFKLLLIVACLICKVTASNTFVPCNFTAIPDKGCPEETTTCNKTTNECTCLESTPNYLGGRCYSNRDVGDLCLSSLVCARIKAKCMDTSGEEISITDRDEKYYYARNILPGVCKCPDGYFFSQQVKSCQDRVLERKCFFTADCFSRSHSSCDNGKCKCKPGFFHDYLADECRPNLITTLCLYGYNWDKEAQKCRPSGSTFHSTDSNISALFWPAVAFFLVIFLLRLLKEGMKRDCERANEGRIRRRQHRILRPRGLGLPHPSSGHSSPLSVPSNVPRQSTEVIVLMPSALPPPYSAHDRHGDNLPAITEEPPTYEEATRTDNNVTNK